MKILVDMNLTPIWCEVLRQSGHEAAHWPEVGDPRAPDAEIMEWADTHGHCIFTHDLDFGALLTATSRHRPSVIQVRTEDVLPDELAETLLSVLSEHGTALEQGALVMVDKQRARIRILPIGE
jgi:predicted nuclease of predicted toxin-antitoxin system